MLKTISTAILTLAFHISTACAGDALQVQVETAETRSFQLDLKLSGTIESWHSVDLGFRQSGRIVEVLVTEGDLVTIGQEMARLDPIQQDQNLKVAEAGLDAAKAAEEQARQATERVEAMLARGVGTRAARDDAQKTLSAAVAAVGRAASNADLARHARDETILRAPSDAIVTGRDMAPGLVVTPARTVLTLARIDGLEAVFRAPEHPLLDNAMGATIRLDVLDIETPELTGTVTEISPLIDPATGTVTVRATINQIPSGTRLLGAAIRGYLQIRNARGIAIPWTALTRSGNGPAVWVVNEQNRAVLAPVEILHFADGLVYLSGGINAGQKIIGAGAQLLYPGRPVRAATVAP